MDELLFNEGFSRVLVRGGRRAGDSVRVEVGPTLAYPSVTVAAVTADSLAGARW